MSISCDPKLRRRKCSGKVARGYGKQRSGIRGVMRYIPRSASIRGVGVNGAEVAV